METLTAACQAMATRFEMVLHGQNLVSLRAAADQAFAEIQRLHTQLNLYSPSSEVSFINARASQSAVQVEPGLFALLQAAQRLHQETGGAFDITIAPLIRCWGFMGGSGAVPDAEQLAEARTQVGMEHVILDEKQSTIRFKRPGMMIDLGSIGKGYALDLALESLIEAGVQNALVHGGTSTVCALGTARDGQEWKVAIDPPPALQQDVRDATGEAAPLAVVVLTNEALSVSAVHGKCFTAHGKTYGHVIDPRSGAPTEGALLAAVILPSATETDALSTALLVSGTSGHDAIADLRPRMRTLVVGAPAGGRPISAVGRGINLKR